MFGAVLDNLEMSQVESDELRETAPPAPLNLVAELNQVNSQIIEIDMMIQSVED